MRYSYILEVNFWGGKVMDWDGVEKDLGGMIRNVDGQLGRIL